MSSTRNIIIDDEIPNWGDLPYTLPADGNWIIQLPKDLTIKGEEYPTSGQVLARRQGQYRRAGDSVEFTRQLPKCQHEFIDVGFSHSKFVCKHCDTEK